MVEIKDGERQNWGAMKFVKPIPFNISLMHEIDKEILQVFDSSHIITPDKVRNGFEILTQGIQKKGWPTLAESRGKLLFVLDNTDEHKLMYLSENPNLEGRVMFVSSVPGESTAGFIKMNDALNQTEQIKEYSSKGYLIRTSIVTS